MHAMGHVHASLNNFVSFSIFFHFFTMQERIVNSYKEYKPTCMFLSTPAVYMQVSGSFDETVRVWDVREGVCIKVGQGTYIAEPSHCL